MVLEQNVKIPQEDVTPKRVRVQRSTDGVVCRIAVAAGRNHAHYLRDGVLAS